MSWERALRGVRPDSLIDAMARHHRSEAEVPWRWITMTLLPVFAVAAAAFDAFVIAGILGGVWLLALMILMFRDASVEMNLARREHDEDRNARRELERIKRRSPVEDVPARRPWRVRRLTAFRDWPEDPPLP